MTRIAPVGMIRLVGHTKEKDMNKRASYKSKSGITSPWLDWVLYIQDLDDIDWLRAEDKVKELIDMGELVEVTS